MKYNAEFDVTIQGYRREHEKHDNGAESWRTHPDGHRRARIRLEIDVDALAQTLGARAMRSQGKKSGMGSGMIKAKVLGPITRVEWA